MRCEILRDSNLGDVTYTVIDVSFIKLSRKDVTNSKRTTWLGRISLSHLAGSTSKLT